MPKKFSTNATVFVPRVPIASDYPIANDYPMDNRNDFNLTSFNILSTHRIEDVIESEEMYTNRYNKIIDNLLSPNFHATFFLLQEVDEYFVELFRARNSIYQIIGPKYFNNQIDKIGTLILINREVCTLVKDYTRDCQHLYNRIYFDENFPYSSKFPFRGQCIHVKYSGIDMIISTFHHSKQQSKYSIDTQLQNSLNCFIEVLLMFNLAHFPFILGGDFYYPGKVISKCLNEIIEQPIYQYVIHPYPTSSHKYIKRGTKIRIQPSSSQADQTIYSNLGLDNIQCHPKDGISLVFDNHPYIYPTLPQKTNYTLREFDEHRVENDPYNTSRSDHVMVETTFNLNHLIPEKVFGKNIKNKKNKKNKKPRKIKKTNKPRKNKKNKKPKNKITKKGNK